MTARIVFRASQSGRICPTPSTCGEWIVSGMILTGSDYNTVIDTFGDVADEVLKSEHVRLSDIIVKTDNCFSSQILFCF